MQACLVFKDIGLPLNHCCHINLHPTFLSQFILSLRFNSEVVRINAGRMVAEMACMIPIVQEVVDVVFRFVQVAYNAVSKLRLFFNLSE
jgi:hypothetical protein